MLRYLNQCSRGRGAWLLLALTALALELTALFFQHVMGLKPCVMCIYERNALFGVLGAGLVGAIAPKSPLRLGALALWIYSAWEGLRLSYEHTMIQLHPNPFTTCDFAARFPSGLPLDAVGVSGQRRLCRTQLDFPDTQHAAVDDWGVCWLSAGRRAGTDCSAFQT